MTWKKLAKSFSKKKKVLIVALGWAVSLCYKWKISIPIIALQAGGLHKRIFLLPFPAVSHQVPLLKFSSCGQQAFRNSTGDRMYEAKLVEITAPSSTLGTCCPARGMVWLDTGIWMLHHAALWKFSCGEDCMLYQQVIFQ